MSDATKPFEGTLVLSSNIDYFRNGDEFYVYHNLFGYILKMSEDVVEFMEYFRDEPRDAAQAVEAFAGRLSDEMVGEFATVLAMQSCVRPPEQPEETRLLEMYPVRARWITVHQPKTGPVTIYALDQSSKMVVLVAALDEWDSRLWRRIDGETSVKDLIEGLRGVAGSPVGGLQERVLATLAQLTHCDMQVLKMSAMPASTFKHRRHGTPPYLISTMPYERITGEVVGESSGPHVSPPGLKREPIALALLDKDAAENTFAHLFSLPHRGLGGDTYGGRLAAKALSAGTLPESPRILEVGGSNGVLARCFLDKLQAVDPARYASARYVIATPDEAMAASQRAALQDHLEHVQIVVSDTMALPSLPEQPFHFVLCDEFAANLDVVAVRKLSAATEEDEDEEEEDEEREGSNGKQRGRDTFIGEGDAVQMIFRYALPLEDAPEDFFLNVGAFRLIEQVQKVLAPGGQAWIIEFGEPFRYPVRTVEESGIAFSLHFGQLQQVARRNGLEPELGYLMETLELERELSMLSTTRSQFKAMRHLLGTLGVSLERYAYPRDEFEALLATAGLGTDELLDLAYEPLEERAMGLVVHSMKVLRLRKPAA